MNESLKPTKEFYKLADLGLLLELAGILIGYQCNILFRLHSHFIFVLKAYVPFKMYVVLKTYTFFVERTLLMLSRTYF